VLVADTTLPDWGTVKKSAAAVVTNRGGRTCHAAMVARELGIPAVVGCDDATTKLRTGDDVTVSCAEGAVGRVYSGALPFTRTTTDLSALARPQVHVMVNIGNPDTAFQTAVLPTEGVGTIAAAFYPRPVIVRLSDFKSNEYASLLGGRWFEPHEENPMIGSRGALRYTHPAYAEGFALECAALKFVREEMGLVNVKLMIPFCRRVVEAERVLRAMAGHGLGCGTNGLGVYVMCEIPNNVIQIDAFAKLFDGFSIGSNDLTQPVLGVDRDSEIVAFDFDERDEGVKEMLRQAIEGGHRNQRHVGICGQAPSDYPEMAEYLVELGIDSLSVTPDTLLAVTRKVLAVEKRLGRPPAARAC
jgi:pyruvate, water dikinase